MNKFYKALLFIIFSVFILGIVFSILSPEKFPKWTGFYKISDNNKQVSVLSKTLWDWLELLIIPIFLSVGAWWFNRNENYLERELQEKKFSLEKKISEEKNQQQILQKYFDDMTDLILNHKLMKSLEKSNIRSIARSISLTTIQLLDSKRKGVLLRFLRESKLIELDPIINLRYADFSEVILENTNLYLSNLKHVNFSYSIISSNKCLESDFSSSDFFMSKVSNSDFVNVNLKLVNFSNSNFINVDISNSELFYLKFRNGTIKLSKFLNIDGYKSDFSSCLLEDCIFKDSNLSMSDFSNSIIKNVDFTNSILTNVNFSNSIFVKVDFYNSEIDLSNFSNCKFIETDINLSKSQVLIKK